MARKTTEIARQNCDFEVAGRRVLLYKSEGMSSRIDHMVRNYGLPIIFLLGVIVSYGLVFGYKSITMLGITLAAAVAVYGLMSPLRRSIAIPACQEWSNGLSSVNRPLAEEVGVYRGHPVLSVDPTFVTAPYPMLCEYAATRRGVGNYVADRRLGSLELRMAEYTV